MKKIWCVLLVMLLVALGGSAFAGVVNVQAIEEKPVNVLSYAKEGAYLGLVFVRKLVESSQPMVLFEKRISGNYKGKPTVRISLIEGLVLKRLNLVGGFTLKANLDNIEPDKYFGGLEYELRLKGMFGKIIPICRPGLYLYEGELCYGLSIGWKLDKPHI